MLKCLVVLLSCSAIVESFTLEPVDFVEVEDFDGVRSYPVLMLSNKPMKSAAIKSKKQRSNDKSDSQSEIADNVREFEPMSREDIKKMKRLTFHGLSPPSAAKNASRNVAPQAAVQVDYLQRKYTLQQRANANRRGATSQEVQSRSYKPYKGYKRENQFKNTDNGFMPLMRPSPINLHPADPPSFAATRNYVDYLKMRQKKFFSEFDEEKSPSEKQDSDEIGYFVQRERELAEEQRPTEAEIGENVDVEFADGRAADIDSNRSYASPEEDEEESKRHENFVPFRMYAQVRHVEAENHKPRSEAPEPKVKEKLSLEKKNVYYKEEGYEEKDYDHGDEVVKKHFRVRREIGGSELKQPIALAIIAESSLKGRSGEIVLKQLEELLKNTSLYLPDDDDSLDNARTKRFPLSTIYGTATNYKSHKYPYYNLPDTNTLNTMSAFRYSENMKNFPQAKESFYNYKNIDECSNLEEVPEPVPSDIEEEGKSTSFNKKPQRLNGLGDKIKCYKDKLFGKDPFDNPLFKEKYVASAIPISYHDSSLIPHQANPLITVYDDVISNIRAAFADEVKKKQEEENLKASAAAGAVPTYEPEQVPASSTIAKTSEFKPITLSSAATVSRLPIFDINNFYPKIKVPLNFDDDDDEVSKPVKKSISKDYEMEFVEVPIKKKVSSRDVLDRSRESNGRDIGQKKAPSLGLRPPNPTPTKPLPEKRRRRNPVSRIHALPISPFYKPPQDKSYKFKLL